MFSGSYNSDGSHTTIQASKKNKGTRVEQDLTPIKHVLKTVSTLSLIS